MPNWCYNKIRITDADLTEVIDFLRRRKAETGDEFSFEWIVPSPSVPEPPVEQPPPTLDDLRAAKTAEDFRNILATMQNPPKSEAFDWYHWNISHWGTKWDASGPCVEIDESDPPKYVELRFETAWSPSLEVTQQFSCMFPAVVFEHTYGEPGCDFSGWATYDDGNLLEHVEGEFMDSEWYNPDDYADD